MSRASADPTVHPAPPVVLPRLSVLAPEAPAASGSAEEAPKATSIGLGLGQSPAADTSTATGWSPTAWRIGRRG